MKEFSCQLFHLTYFPQSLAHQFFELRQKLAMETSAGMNELSVVLIPVLNLKTIIVISPPNIYLSNNSNLNTRNRSEIVSEIKITERRQYRSSGDFIVNFEHIFQLFHNIKSFDVEYLFTIYLF